MSERTEGSMYSLYGFVRGSKDSLDAWWMDVNGSVKNMDERY